MRDGRIEYLIHLVEKSEIAELEIHEGLGRRIRILKRAAPAASPALVASHPALPAAPAAPAASAAPAPAPAPAPEDENFLKVVSPMVGTFYRSPSPGSPPFVEVGTHVVPGQTLCIIEAMKLMNEITSEVSGSVRRILVENKTPVEFGQTLFLIDKSS